MIPLNASESSADYWVQLREKLGVSPIIDVGYPASLNAVRCSVVVPPTTRQYAEDLVGVVLELSMHQVLSEGPLVAVRTC